MTGQQVDGALVVCIILTAFLVVGAVSGLLAVGAKRFEAWLDEQLAARHRAIEENLADPILAAHRRVRWVPRQLDDGDWQ